MARKKSRQKNRKANPEALSADRRRAGDSKTRLKRVVAAASPTWATPMESDF